jgi:hypothetical protein
MRSCAVPGEILFGKQMPFVVLESNPYGKRAEKGGVVVTLNATNAAAGLRTFLRGCGGVS